MPRNSASVWSLAVILFTGLGAGSLTSAHAQGPTGGYDAITAGEDAYRYHEQMRQGNIRTQLGLIDQLRWSPWPFVPGDIYGFQWIDPVPQSIGQREIQTGPNRWESHPVYPGDFGVGLVDRSPVVRREALPVEPIRAEPREMPGEMPRRRPREF